MAILYAKGIGVESASSGQAVTPGVAFGKPTKGIWVGGGGNLAVKLADETEVTLENVPDGALVPVAAQEVLAATTATAMVALF